MGNQSRGFLAIAVHLALSASLSAMAAEAGDDREKVTELGKIAVDAEVSSYKAQVPSSPKYTELLRDTPQTITVIPAALTQQQGGLLLRDVLRQNVPGITFGAGEGGSYGDSINIRGFTATNDIAVDGVRQSANTTHTDPFNTQAIEVLQGTSSVYSGRYRLCLARAGRGRGVVAGGVLAEHRQLLSQCERNHVFAGPGELVRPTA
jgi:catecholate siderophore receptor